jgi:hypothetical protein
MYLFSIVSMPLAYLALAAWSFQGGDVTRRAFSRGLLFGLPSVAVWALLRPLYAFAWGSPLLVLAFLLRYWIVPFGLTAAAYGVSVGFYGLSRGDGYDRLVAFVFGSMTAFGAAFAVSTWGNPSRVFAILVPILAIASAVSFPAVLEEAAKDGMPDGLKAIALTVGAFSLAACSAALCFMRLEWLGLMLAAACLALSYFVGVRRLISGR